MRAVWTDDEQLSTRINAEVAHYTGQAELADAIRDGLEARKAGDDRTATLKLGPGRAAGRRRRQRGHQAPAGQGRRGQTTPATGTVRLQPQVDKLDEMALDTRSTKTVRVNKG